MKKFLAICLLLSVIGSVFCACESKEPESIYDLGLKIEETSIRLFGESDAYIINDRLAVSKEVILQWSRDTSATFEFLIYVFDEYDLDINFDKECSTLTKAIGAYTREVNSYMQSEGYETDFAYQDYKKQLEASKQRMNERVAELKDKKAEDLKAHLDSLGVTYEPFIFEGFVTYDGISAILNLDQALTFLDTRFVYIEITDIHAHYVN